MKRSVLDPVLFARDLFKYKSTTDPSNQQSRGDKWPHPISFVRDFYSESPARIALVLSIAIPAYVGGAIMFWFHSVYLHEGGPAISPWLHWLFDSTAGYLALGPIIAVILPLAAWLASRRGREVVDPGRFAIAAGSLLAVATGPAPLMHNAFIARGTWLADRVTALFGNGYNPHAHPKEVSATVEVARQVLAGIPIYIPIMYLALLAGRGAARLVSSRRAAQ